MNKKLLWLFILAFLVASPAHAEETDPFVPQVSPPSSKSSGSSTSTSRNYSSNIIELDKYPLATYRLIGIIIAKSKKQEVAVLRSQDGQDYFVKLEDAIGKEGGIIKKINLENMVVEVGEEIKTITVGNKVIEAVDANKKVQ